MNQYEQFLEALLFRENYLLGQDLNEELQREFKNVTPVYGRKIIQRAVDSQIIAASIITFGKNQYAYVHPKKPLSKALVLEIAASKRPPLFRLIVMLDYYHGVLSHYEALKIAACPLEEGKSKNDSVDKLFREITLLGYANQVANKDGVRFLIYPKYSQNPAPLFAKTLQRMSIDAMFIPDILRALQRFNIISGINVLYRSKSEPHLGVSHNNFIWDSTAYTRTTGINEGRSSEANGADKQTLVILDVVISRNYTDQDLQGFFARIQGTTSSVKTGKRKVLPIVIYSGVESKILLNRIRKLGFLSFDVGTIYGSNIYRIIECLQAVKKINDFSSASLDDLVEEALELIGNSGQEDNLSNLKGDLFESLMFPVLQSMVPGADIEQSRKLKTTVEGKKLKYEYDYILTSSRLKEILVVELKGFSGSKYISLGDGETQNTIKWFFSNTYPFAKSILNTNHNGYKITACYITTADFYPDGVEHLEKLQESKLKPSNIDVWYNGTKLISLLEQHGFDTILALIRKYYIKPDHSKTKIPFTPAENVPERSQAVLLDELLPSLDDF